MERVCRMRAAPALDIGRKRGVYSTKGESTPSTHRRKVAWHGMRPCTELNPCDCFMKYAVVLDEQPMPLILAARCGGRSRSQNACTSAAVTESCPHPAQSAMIPAVR